VTNAPSASRMSRERIRQALVDLAKEQRLPDISVTELLKRASCFKVSSSTASETS
jgi:hypothetical protein